MSIAIEILCAWVMVVIFLKALFGAAEALGDIRDAAKHETGLGR